MNFVSLGHSTLEYGNQRLSMTFTTINEHEKKKKNIHNEFAVLTLQISLNLIVK